MRHIAVSAVVAIIVLAIACSSPGEPNVQLQAPVLEIITGDGQVDTVAKQLPIAVTARAVEQLSAKAMPGVILNWFKVTETDSVFVAAGVTNDSGIARLRWTLGTKAGPQGLVAWALDDEGRRAVHAQATATALPGPIAYAGFTVPRIRVLGESTFVLPVDATDAYGNAVANPPIVALTDTVLVPAAPGTWRAARPGIGRYRLDSPQASETLAVYVYAPAQSYRAERTVGDSLFVETGTLVFDMIDSSFADPAEWVARYHVADAMSILTRLGVTSDTVQGSESVGGTVHQMPAPAGGPLYLHPLRLGPTGTTNLTQHRTTFVTAAGGRWRFTINGVASDSLVIVR